MFTRGLSASTFYLQRCRKTFWLSYTRHTSRGPLETLSTPRFAFYSSVQAKLHDAEVHEQVDEPATDQNDYGWEGENRELAVESTIQGNHSPSKRVFVSGFKQSITDEQLRKLGQKFGEVSKVRIVRRDGVSQGFGHMQFYLLDDARAFVEAHSRDPVRLAGRVLRIEYSPSSPLLRNVTKDGSSVTQPQLRSPSNAVSVGNLAYDIDPDYAKLRLTEEFMRFGNFWKVSLGVQGNSFAGFAHVWFYDMSSAKAAVEEHEQTPMSLDGRQLWLNYGEPRAIPKPNYTLYVESFPGIEGVLKNELTPFRSQIQDILVLPDRKLGSRIGAALIKFWNTELAKEALNALNGKEVLPGVRLSLSFALDSGEFGGKRSQRQPGWAENLDSKPKPAYGTEWGGGRKSEKYQPTTSGLYNRDRYSVLGPLRRDIEKIS